jgi:hypothetical protein
MYFSIHPFILLIRSCIGGGGGACGVQLMGDTGVRKRTTTGGEHGGDSISSSSSISSTARAASTAATAGSGSGVGVGGGGGGATASGGGDGGSSSSSSSNNKESDSATIASFFQVSECRVQESVFSIQYSLLLALD